MNVSLRGVGASGILLVALGASSSCKGAPQTQVPPAPVEVPPPAPDPRDKACAQHIEPSPPPPHPTWSTSCELPALPDGYPVPRPTADRPWQQGKAAPGPLTVRKPKDIAKLLAALKAYVAPVFDPYLLDPTNADKRPDKQGWRMMPWVGDLDCALGASGRDASAGTSTGQLIPRGTLPGQRTDDAGDLQNHSITWYDPWAAFALSSVFGAGKPGEGDPSKQQLVDGSVLVKIAVLTPYADGSEWPTAAQAPVWPVYRPPVGPDAEACPAPPSSFKLISTRVLQFDIIVKSSFYAPETEWVFATWLYDPDAKGSTPLDKFTALGAMWGNDPGIAQKDLCTPVKPLQQNWINPEAPAYGYQQLGWGCRLAGPIDVARRPVTFDDGSSCGTARVSSCLSCHGSSEFVHEDAPKGTEAATMYPLVTGYDKAFTLALPGSPQWGNWFSSRAPTDPQGDQHGANKTLYTAFDYDMIFILSVPISRAAHGRPGMLEQATKLGVAMRDARKAVPWTRLTTSAVALSTSQPVKPPAGCDCSCLPAKRRKSNL
ncbi:MAG TPA: hypothetical protein VFX59_05395 [Polyangiales bacterium]|nr:hypothetical protein [Polyangiales bacterium]